MSRFSSSSGIEHGILIGDDREPARAVSGGPVAIPTIAVEGLRARDDIFDGGAMTAHAIALDDLAGIGMSADQGRGLPGAEGKDIVHAGAHLRYPVADHVVMRQVALHAGGMLGVPG